MNILFFDGQLPEESECSDVVYIRASEGVGLVFESENADTLVDGLTALRRQSDLYKECQNGLVATMRYDLTLFILETVGEIVSL